MKIDKTKVKRILVISLSNIGDVILTTPVIQVLRNNFPQAHLAVLVSPRAFDVFKSDKRIDRKIIYDKAIKWKNKIALLNRLRLDKYDLVVDLRQTAFSLFLGARYRTSIWKKAPKSLVHMKDRHLWKLESLGLEVGDIEGPSIIFSENDEEYIEQMFAKWQIKNRQTVIAIAPGARSMTKRWEKEEYRQLIERLIEIHNIKIIMVGDEHDKVLAEEISFSIKPKPINACAQTSIGQLAFLLTKSKLLISNDSAPMHLAWAVHTPVIAIFGPTNHRKYAPAGPEDIVIRKDLTCAPCEKSLCPTKGRECMKLISADEVFLACKRILGKPVCSR
jgi:ADP-heptose:LPS heptosyltransferase